MRRRALLALLAACACGPAEDTGLSLVARREGENGYLVWGRTRAAAPLELSVEDGERVLFGPVPLLVHDGRFRADIAIEATRRPPELYIAERDGAREWRVGLPRWRREVRFGPPLPEDPPPPEILPPAERVPRVED